MQTSEGNTACLQTGLNGLDKRVFMRSPLLVLDKLSTDPKGPPSSPRTLLSLAPLPHRTLENGSTTTTTPQAAKPVENTMDSTIPKPANQVIQDNTPAVRKRGRHSKVKTSVAKKSKTVKVISPSAHSPKDMLNCNGALSEASLECENSLQQGSLSQSVEQVNHTGTSHSALPGSFSVCVPSTPPVTVAGMTSTSFLSENLSSQSYTIPSSPPCVTLGAGSVSPAVVTAPVVSGTSPVTSASLQHAHSSVHVSSFLSSVNNETTSSFQSPTTNIGQASIEPSGQANKFSPEFKPGSHYCFLPMSTTPGCARLLPANYLFLEQSALKRMKAAKTKKKKKTKSLHQLSNNLIKQEPFPVKQEPFSSTDEIASDSKSTGYPFSPISDYSSFNPMSIKREPITSSPPHEDFPSHPSSHNEVALHPPVQAAQEMGQCELQSPLTSVENIDAHPQTTLQPPTAEVDMETSKAVVDSGGPHSRSVSVEHVDTNPQDSSQTPVEFSNQTSSVLPQSVGPVSSGVYQGDPKPSQNTGASSTDYSHHPGVDPPPHFPLPPTREELPMSPKDVNIEELLSSFTDGDYQITDKNESTDDIDDFLRLNLIPVSSAGNATVTQNGMLPVSQGSHKTLDLTCGLSLLTPPSENPTPTNDATGSSQDLPNLEAQNSNLLSMPLINQMEEAPLPVEEVEVGMEKTGSRDGADMPGNYENSTFRAISDGQEGETVQRKTPRSRKRKNSSGKEAGKVTPIKIIRMRKPGGEVSDVALKEVTLPSSPPKTRKGTVKKKVGRKPKGKKGAEAASDSLDRMDSKGSNDSQTPTSAPSVPVDSVQNVQECSQIQADTVNGEPPEGTQPDNTKSPNTSKTESNHHVVSTAAQKIQSPLKGKQKKKMKKGERAPDPTKGNWSSEPPPAPPVTMDEKIPPESPSMDLSIVRDLLQSDTKLDASMGSSKAGSATESPGLDESLKQSGFTFNLEMLKERIGLSTGDSIPNCSTKIQTGNGNRKDPTPIVFKLEDVIKQQQQGKQQQQQGEEQQQEQQTIFAVQDQQPQQMKQQPQQQQQQQQQQQEVQNRTDKSMHESTDGNQHEDDGGHGDMKSFCSLTSISLSPPLSGLDSPPSFHPPANDEQEEGDMLEIHPLDYRDEDISLLGEAVCTKSSTPHPATGQPAAHRRRAPATPPMSPDDGRLGASRQQQNKNISLNLPNTSGFSAGSARQSVYASAPANNPLLRNISVHARKPAHQQTSPPLLMHQSSGPPFVNLSPGLTSPGTRTNSSLYGKGSTVEQRTMDWIVNHRHCPPPPFPLPPQDSSVNISHNSVDADCEEDFPSASIVNEPIMTTFSSSPKEELTHFKQWRGFCKFWHTEGKCESVHCYYKHGESGGLPKAVAEHLQNVNLVARLTGIFRPLLNDDIVNTVVQIRRDLNSRLCVKVWGNCLLMKQKGVNLSIAFYEELLTRTAESSPMTEELCGVAQKCFEWLKSARMRSLPEDFNFLILCYLRCNNLPRASDLLKDMQDEGMIPSKETLYAFMDSMGKINVTTTPGMAMLRIAFRAVLKFIHQSANVLLKIFLKNPQEFSMEILMTIDEAVKLDKFSLRSENLIPIIDICLANDRSLTLSKFIRHCRCIDLLPAESIVSLIRALGSRKLEPSLFLMIVQNAQKEHLKAVDVDLWSDILDMFCHLHYMRDIKLVQSICKQNSIQLPDQILWKLINTFLRGPDLRSAVETFKDLEELQEENMRITSGLCQSLIVQNDWERLMCVCQKMLEKKMPVHYRELFPLFQFLSEQRQWSQLATICQLVMECPDAHAHIPLAVLTEAERNLSSQEECQAVCQRLAGFLKSIRPNPMLQHASSTADSQMLQDCVQAFMITEEWDIVALSLKKITPFPLELGEALFVSLSSRLSDHKAFEKPFCLFTESITKDLSPALSSSVSQLAGRVGLSLLLAAASSAYWESGFTTLHQLHKHGVHYIDHIPYTDSASVQFPTKCSRMMAGVLVCVRISPEAAVEVLRGCSWQQPEEGCARDLELIRKYIPDLLTKYIGSNNLNLAQEILSHMGSFLVSGGSNEYHTLFAEYLATKQIEKAYNICTILIGKLKSIRKKKLLEMLECLRSVQPPSDHMQEQKRTLVHLAVESGIFPNIKGKAPLSISLPEGIAKEEVAWLVENFIEDVCINQSSLGDIVIFFPSKALLHSSMDYILQFFTPHLLYNWMEDSESEPYIRVSQSSLESWRRANVPNRIASTSYVVQQEVGPSTPPNEPPAPPTVGSSSKHDAKKRETSIFRGWQKEWRSAVHKKLGILIQPYRNTRFNSKEDRHHFLRNLCLFYCKRTERECRGPWSLDDTNQTELQAIVERLMSGMLVYDPTKSLSLDP